MSTHPHAARRTWQLPAAALATLILAACNGTGASSSSVASASASVEESMAASTSASASASASEETGASLEITVADTSAGSSLVGPDGMTLYVFDNDSSGVSTCTGGCADNWPPLTVADGQGPEGGEGVSGQLATITRDDGSTQVTYDGRPLYYYAGDSAAGDANGEGVGGVWFIADPSGGAAASASAYDY